jgi:D-alanyl-D-alanine carboxypeptidase (penicillin-binding protein 5/6)
VTTPSPPTPDAGATGDAGGAVASETTGSGAAPLPVSAVMDITAPITAPDTVILTHPAAGAVPEPPEHAVPESTQQGEADSPAGAASAAEGAARDNTGSGVLVAPAAVVEPVLVAPAAVVEPVLVTPPGDPPAAGRRHGRKRGHRRIAVAIAIVVALLLSTAGWAGAQRINRPLAPPVIQSGVPAALTVAGSSPALPWPAKGQGAVSIPALGYAQQSGLEASVPIASLTKMTNALVVLRDHPVPAGATGPSITITAADEAEYDNELHNDQSTVPIRTGEVLTELQMLEALLTQSANDMAYSLAMWDAGSIPAFVAKMNALAVSLGTTSTHYVDASGYDPGSVSTASDCLRVAAAAMLDPTFAAVVGMSSISFPGVGTVPNVVSEIGKNGVIGIKSGYTSEAGGCLVLAADRVVGDHSVLVLVAVLGQPTPPPIVPKTTTTTAPRPPPTTTTTAPAPGVVPPPTTPPPPTTVPPPPPTTTTTVPVDDLEVPDPLRYTRPVTEALLQAALAGVVPVAVATKGAAVGTATAQWGSQPHRVAVEAGQSASVLGWPGQQVAATTSLHPVRAGEARGAGVGTAHYTLGTQSETVPLTLASTVPEPSWWWRLLHD